MVSFEAPSPGLGALWFAEHAEPIEAGVPSACVEALCGFYGAKDLFVLDDCSGGPRPGGRKRTGEQVLQSHAVLGAEVGEGEAAPGAGKIAPSEAFVILEGERCSFSLGAVEMLEEEGAGVDHGARRAHVGIRPWRSSLRRSLA
jgi:hypothetical protein